MARSLQVLSEVRVFNGFLRRFEHCSSVLGNLQMKFAVYVPDKGVQGKVPSLYYLSGLTCTDENCSQKGTAGFKAAGELGLAVILPDTSPRGHEEIPGENDAYDFGTGAGFYLNATKEPWSKHYLMYDYVVKELPALCAAEFSWYDAGKVSITGHSMGGHGALTIGLKNPDTYKSVSAFAPIVNPLQCPWGEKAFSGYLANPQEEAKEYDAVELIRSGKTPPGNALLVDQGTADNFFCKEVNQLLTKNLEAACAEKGIQLECNYREGYDHSYYFISSFFENHIKFHHKALS